MSKRKPNGWQKSTRNANRAGGTSTRPDGRVDAYLTIDTPTEPHRLKTTHGIMGHADARTTLKIYTHFEEEREGGRRPPGRLPGRDFGVEMTARLSATAEWDTTISGRYAGSARRL
jgi:hypothetical protein